MSDLTILLADDDDGHRELIRRNLRRAGVENELLHFADGYDVWEYLAVRREAPPPGQPRHGPYLLLLDINMPRVDGLEVLRRVKADLALRSIPVIMMTTTDDPLEMRACHELGCAAYITKPVAYRAFVEAIGALGAFILLLKVPPLGG